MANWEKVQENQVNKWLGNDCHCKCIGFSLTSPSTSKIIDFVTDKYDLILGFDYTSNIYAAWNPYLHNYRKESYSVSIRFVIKDEFNDYFSFYTPLQNGKGEYEKKLLILPEFLQTFCKNWRSYLKPDSNEKDYKPNQVLWFDKYLLEPMIWEDYCKSNKELVQRDKEIVTREREIVSRNRRESSFRKRVLEKYNYQCCICRCSIEQLLEAAHIQAVSEKGDDSSENGILLCRNHHKMVDEGMIKIHGDKLEVCDERVKEMPWYKDFVIEHKEKVKVSK